MSERLRLLGTGVSIAALCERDGWSRTQFDAWWREETARRTPREKLETVPALREAATIERDSWGIPHIRAAGHDDLWFGFGYAMAQDRLFQMDYLRRKGWGTLSEVLGSEGLPIDLVARTVGLNRITRAEGERLPQETRTLLEAFAGGVNAWMTRAADRLPVEFDLLDYRPEPWTWLDCLAIENEFRWYLTGRLPVIVMPELAKRGLGDGPLYREFLLGEADDEAIVPREAYAAATRPPASGSLPAGGPAEPTGSNNWVVAGRHTRSGRPMVASDPHIAIEAVSCWYEACLQGGQYDVMGMAYVGMPAIMAGRNRRVAWGITNNICSLRDLYQERIDASHPGCFLFGDRWEPAREITEVIKVKGAETVTRTIRCSRNGPVVDEILPTAAQHTGPVTLRWLGAEQGGWLTALLGMDRAENVAQFRAALEPWHVPTFNLVVADVDGQIAVQCAGRIPQRKAGERGYRPGWDPEHQWTGLLPFDKLPHAVDPSRGWLASANNRLVDDDYEYPVFGTWSSGYRARRIRQMIEQRLAQFEQSGGGFDRDAFRRMQYDCVSLRAAECLPALTEAVARCEHASSQAVLEHLQAWDGRVEPEWVAPAVFNVFFTFWTEEVVRQRFEGATAELLAKQAEGLASRLLTDDPLGWFAEGQRESALQHAVRRTLDHLAERCGDKVEQWTWSALHRLPMAHVLASRGDLAQLLNQNETPVRGDMVTVCNTGSGPGWSATTGAGYRMIVDLADEGLWALDGQSQSGHPASEHYGDQLQPWLDGEYHRLSS